MNKLFCGIDLGTRSSALCIIDEKRTVIKRWSGRNDRLIRELSEVEGDLACVVEAAPLAESVSKKVEDIGVKIEIVDSRHVKGLMHGKKTDRIDAQVLAELACSGWYKVVHRKSGKAREDRTIVAGRAALVGVTTKLKNTLRGLLKANGVVLPSEMEGVEFLRQVRESMKHLSQDAADILMDLLQVWLDAYRRQRRSYRKLKRLADGDPVMSRLMTVPGVGPATAFGFSSSLVNPQRFPDGSHVAAYLGLAPRVHQSGETNYHGRITKQGDKLTRWLLIEAAHVMLTRTKRPFPLREWGLRLAEKKGMAKAKVAVARRLAMLLFTLWKQQKDFSLQYA